MTTNIKDIVAFSRTVEALSPQDPPRPAPTDKTTPVRTWVPPAPPMWLDKAFLARWKPDSKAWKFTLFGGTYDKQRFISGIEQCLSPQENVYEDRPGGRSCAFSFSIDENGTPLPESLMLSMAAWAYGVITSEGFSALTLPTTCDLTDLHSIEALPEQEAKQFRESVSASDSGFPGFDKLLDQLREEMAWRVGHIKEGDIIDFPWINDISSLIIDKLRLTDLVDENIPLIKGSLVHRPKQKQGEEKSIRQETQPKKNDDDLLNSFFIKDLTKILQSKDNETPKSIQNYLETSTEANRIDVIRNKDRALKILDPERFPVGCWPSEHPLVWSQQLAINSFWDNHHADGCFAVNGPPGTGKTTLLRDIVAAIVVERAMKLSKLGPAALGKEHQRIDIGSRSIRHHNLHPSLSGYSIVVASSNNGAVENISLELPKIDAIHSRWLPFVDAYSDIATALLGKPAWGLISGRLGNKSNRSEFINTFWYMEKDENNQISGLRERLKEISLGAAKPAMSWDEAKRQFDESLAEEQRARKTAVNFSTLSSKTKAKQSELEEFIKTLKLLSAKLTESLAESNALAYEVEMAQKNQVRLLSRIDLLIKAKPGLLDWISTFGKSHAEWRGKINSLLKSKDHIESHIEKLEKLIKGANYQIEKLNSDYQNYKKLHDIAEEDLAECVTTLFQAQNKLGNSWPDLSKGDEAQEKSSPWHFDQWRNARIRTFTSALNLHRAFIENNASQMGANLSLAMEALAGRLPDKQACVAAFDSLAIACPVISTTFASVGTLFSNLPAASIGFLLIDEAGQATPQAAAGAIWRAKRVVAVGDPLQLEPVVTIPRTVEAALAHHFGRVDHHWHPSRTSVQMLVDETTLTGTTLREGEDAIWVGAPLRVHRRCENPMFEISNRVAYDGLMVHQARTTETGWPASCWLHVPRGQANGNWLPPEGEMLTRLLEDLINDKGAPGDDIFLISPFRNVVTELRSFSKKFHLDPAKVGTVHTTQGKEASIVILVLGGGTLGALDWAASKPNLLNVAVSRAKTRLYVIGDKAAWGKRRYFEVATQLLNSHYPFMVNESTN